MRSACEELRKAPLGLFLLALVWCAGAQADPASSTTASSRTLATSPSPRTCPIGTNVAQPGNCLLDEGWSNQCQATCKITGLGAGVHPLGPIASALHVSVSSSSVAVGGSYTVRATVAAPRCTQALINSSARCWNSIVFGSRRQYLPLNYSSLYSPPLVRYNQPCTVLEYYSSYKGTSCDVKLVWGFGPRKIPPGHDMVITVQDDVFSGGKGAEQIDIAEVALRFGPAPKKCGSPGGASCPLKVFVRVLQPIRSGLALDTLDPSEGSVNFTIPSYSKSGSVYGEAGEAAQRCMSGCANLLVRVIDPKRHKPVKGASVTVSVDPVDHVKGAGHEFVCTSSDPTKLRCGATALSGLTTDANGQLHLIYWAPSVVQVEKTTLTVSARARTYPRPGATTTPLTIKPYLIYDKLATFSALEVRELIETARSGIPSSVMSHYLEEPFKSLLEHSFAWLANDENLAAAAFTTTAERLTTPIFLSVEIAHLGIELVEQEKLIDVFLEAFDLPAYGLERSAHEPRADGRVAGTFSDDILHGLWIPAHLRTGGLIWNFAQHLSQVMSPAHAHEQSLQLQIYEVSYCDEADALHCGPGFRTADGIHPKLCFLFTTDDLSPNFLDYFCLNQYDPLAFVEKQDNLKGRIS
jgi:hypothetical protein